MKGDCDPSWVVESRLRIFSKSLHLQDPLERGLRTSTVTTLTILIVIIKLHLADPLKGDCDSAETHDESLSVSPSCTADPLKGDCDIPGTSTINAETWSSGCTADPLKGDCD